MRCRKKRDCHSLYFRRFAKDFFHMLAPQPCEQLIRSMFGVTTSDDYKPVTWMGRFPVDVTTILVATHVAVAVIGCIVVAIPGLGGLLNLLVFDSAQILYRLQLWRLV